MVATATQPSLHPDQAIALLRRRVHVLLAVVLTSNLVFALGDVRYPPTTQAVVFGCKAFQLAELVWAFVALHRPRTRRELIAIALVTVAVSAAMSATSGIFTGSAGPTAILSVAGAVFTAAMLPWGALPQATTVMIVMLAMSANEYGVSGTLSGIAPDLAFAVAVALVISILIAAELARHRTALVDENQERKQAETALRATQEWLQLAVESSNIGLWDWNLLTNLTIYSPMWKRQLGYGPDEVAADLDSWWEILHPDDRKRVISTLQAYIQHDGQYEIELRLRHKDGSYRWMLSRAAILHNDRGQPYRMIGSHVDITDQKQAQAELRSAKELAEAAARAKSEFLAVMSHEIRTPMNGVIGMTGLLLDTPLTVQQHDYAETIRSSGEALLAIINDVLDFSKIDAGRLELETIDFALRPVVEEAVDLFAESAQGKGLELACLIYRDVPQTVRGDPGRVRQVLTNLVANAVKFTERGEVVVRVKLVAQATQAVVIRFEVTDTGVGLTSAVQGRLFQAFSQADASTTRQFGGTGLGLAISKRLAEMMGGEIGAEGAPGKGSTFWFTVRLQPAAATGRADSPTAVDLAGCRILIVDDNATNRQIVKLQLEAMGVEATSVADAAQAMSELQAAATAGRPYELAMLDMQMPVTDGLALARRIRADPLLLGTRLILLTSISRPAEPTELNALGIAACLTKPIHQSELRDCIAQLLERPATSKAPSPTSQALAAPAASFGRILVAEDNAVNQRVVVHMLAKLGYRADVVGNGLEALDALARIPYAAVLMDCYMPEMDGFDATTRIRAREQQSGDHTKIIAITANALRGDRERCLAAGMDDYISKPVRPEELDAALRRLRGSSNPAASPSVTPAPDTPITDCEDPLDRDALMRRLDNNRDFVRLTATLFLDDAPRLLADIRAALAQNDAATAERLAHSLRGAASMLAAKPTASAAGRLELTARAGNVVEATAEAVVLAEELERLRPLLRALAESAIQ